MTAIGKGDLVEAVKTCEEFGRIWCTKGDVRRVAEVIHDPNVEPCYECGDASPMGLALEGVETPNDWYWCHCAWKPVPPSRKEMLNDLLKVPDAKRLERA